MDRLKILFLEEKGTDRDFISGTFFVGDFPV
jgi:hypothetical protein